MFLNKHSLDERLIIKNWNVEIKGQNSITVTKSDFMEDIDKSHWWYARQLLDDSLLVCVGFS